MPYFIDYFMASSG